MLNDAPTHPKMKSLARLLGVRLYATVGLMELLWQFTSKYACQGDIGRWTDVEIAAGLDWEHDPELLIKALSDVRFIDPHDDYRLVIHNWAKRCDNTVHRRVAVMGAYFWCGTRPNFIRFTREKRQELQEFYDALDRKRGVKAPVITHRATYDDAWEQFWQLYPRKKHKERAYKQWKALKLSPSDSRHVILQLQRWLQHGAFAEEQHHIPYPYNWLQHRYYNEPLETTRPEEEPGGTTGLEERWPSEEDINIGIHGDGE